MSQSLPGPPGSPGDAEQAVALEHLLVSPDDSLRRAMQVIDRGGCEIALAVDERGHLVGTLTDGDVRRALLAGRTLDDPIKEELSTQPVTVTVRDSRPEVLDLMRAHRIAQIPVVDEQRALVGLHLLDALIGSQPVPNLVVVMAGGRGSRLGSLTHQVPKPMLTVAGRPILERLILHLVGSGVSRIAISVNYLSHIIEDHFGDGAAFGCRIDYLREDVDRPLGTAGSLSLLRETIGVPAEPVLVLNGDLVTQFSVRDLLRYHDRTGSAATVAVREYTHEVPFGVVEASDDGLMASMVEKPVQSWLINAGIYVLNPALIERIPLDVELALPSLIESARQAGETIGLWHLLDEWIDVGRRSELERARGGEA